MTGRRKFLKTMVTGAAATVAAPAFAIGSGTRQWKMVMSWPKALPGLGTSGMRLAERITRLSDGKLTVKVYGGGELVPPLGVFDAVSEGSAELGHSVPYYWLSKNRSCAFFATVPGGLTAQEQNAWLYFADGLKLWHELYGMFGLIAFPAGNTGVQMGGWFKRKLNTLSDLKGLKMRIPGIAGEVFAKLGGNPQNIPGQELFTALQSGVIDALEWIGPWNDMAMGFHRVANYYYGPGFHEGGPSIELMINRNAYEALPEDLQKIVKTAATAENMLMEAEYVANNIQSFRDLKMHHPNIVIDTYPKDILKAFYQTSEEVVADTANLGAINKKIFESYQAFRKTAIDMGKVTELAFMEGRLLK